MIKEDFAQGSTKRITSHATVGLTGWRGTFRLHIARPALRIAYRPVVALVRGGVWKLTYHASPQDAVHVRAIVLAGKPALESVEASTDFPVQKYVDRLKRGTEEEKPATMSACRRRMAYEGLVERVGAIDVPICQKNAYGTLRLCP